MSEQTTLRGAVQQQHNTTQNIRTNINTTEEQANTKRGQFVEQVEHINTLLRRKRDMILTKGTLQQETEHHGDGNGEREKKG